MFPFMPFCLGFSILVFVFELYLNIRQYRKLQENNLPKKLEGIVGAEGFAKAQRYGREKMEFEFITNGVDLLVTIFTLTCSLLPWFWDVSGSIIGSWGYGPEYEVVQSIVFAALLVVVSELFALPWSAYRTFVIEQKHGFNNTTVSTFFLDFFKQLALYFIIGGPVVAAALHIIKWGGDHFYIYVWAFFFVVQIFLLLLYPSVIQPLFNKVTPLPEGELRDRIEELAKQVHFPLTRINVIDGSTRSSHSNAYFYGLFNHKYIVLYDTLLKQVSQEEILAILAHELGHWYHNHMIKSLIIIEIQTFINFFLFAYLASNEQMFHSFGFNTQPTIVGLLLFQYVYSPISQISGFLMNVLSRQREFQADEYSAKLGHSEKLQSGLIAISRANLSSYTLNPDAFYSTYHFSHPPLLERLGALKKHY